MVLCSNYCNGRDAVIGGMATDELSLGSQEDIRPCICAYNNRIHKNMVAEIYLLGCHARKETKLIFTHL